MRRILPWLLAALVVLAAGFGFREWSNWPDVARLAREDPPSTAYIERWCAREQAAGRAGTVEWWPVPYEWISDDLKVAVVVAEDIEFFSHGGFSTVELKEALREAWEEKEAPRGASTITQQLAKNLWLSPSRSPWRKAKEAILTWQLERHLSKRRVLELYLNVAELGPGVYGAEAAAWHWYGKGAGSLTREEAAQLAASLPRPSKWNPASPSPSYARHVERILGRIERTEWLRRRI